MHSFPTRTAIALLLTLPLFASPGAKLRAEETSVPSASVPVVWTLDNITSIGGHAPHVLGTPRVVGTVAGGPALQFNGRSDGLVFSTNPIAGWPKFTIEALVRPDADGLRAQRFLHIGDGHNSRALLETRGAAGQSWILDTYLKGGNDDRTLRNRAKRHPSGKWAWVALVYDGKRMTDYVNGVRQMEGNVNFPAMAGGSMSLGVRLNQVYWFKGCIRQVRFHPAPLAPSALQRVTE
jgi:hypothetical protein